MVKKVLEKRGMKEDSDIIFTVLPFRSEQTDHGIRENCAYCFVVMHTVKDTKGGMIKKRPLKH